MGESQKIVNVMLLSDVVVVEGDEVLEVGCFLVVGAAANVILIAWCRGLQKSLCTSQRWMPFTLSNIPQLQSQCLPSVTVP